jgi:succinate-semialdehyde dehydrogenase/glutarate-semialdehyde dehydrogenase
MELGGNAPFIVFEDADIAAAVEGCMIAKMRNLGEACTAANRIFVHESVESEFTKRFSEKMGALKVGNGLDKGIDVGPLVNAETRDKVVRFVDDALAKGAKLVLGGKKPDGKGYFYPPTVTTNVPDNAECLRDEIFGPVAMIQTFKDQDEVIKRANDTEYGLVAYLYTEDLKRGLQVSERLDYGMIGLNRGLVSDPAAPFGGVKQSGLGREGGHEGMLEFMETQYISTVTVGWAKLRSSVPTRTISPAERVGTAFGLCPPYNSSASFKAGPVRARRSRSASIWSIWLTISTEAALPSRISSASTMAACSSWPQLETPERP